MAAGREEAMGVVRVAAETAKEQRAVAKAWGEVMEAAAAAVATVQVMRATGAGVVAMAAASVAADMAGGQPHPGAGCTRTQSGSGLLAHSGGAAHKWSRQRHLRGKRQMTSPKCLARATVTRRGACSMLTTDTPRWARACAHSPGQEMSVPSRPHSGPPRPRRTTAPPHLYWPHEW